MPTRPAGSSSCTRSLPAGNAIVPWDRGTPNALLVEWAGERDGAGQSAVVVGCGLGRDSEYLASLGYRTAGFDLSETAIRGARERHPESSVQYEAAESARAARHYLRAAFDLVVESYTVQSLPDPPRADAIAAVRTLVAPGGTLLVIAAAGDDGAEVGGPPWPLTRAEIDAFGSAELPVRHIERLVDQEGTARWRAEFGG